MRRLGAMVDRAVGTLGGGLSARERGVHVASGPARRVLDLLDEILPPDLASCTDVSLEGRRRVVITTGSPAAHERVQALLPIIVKDAFSASQPGRALDEDREVAITCRFAPGAVRVSRRGYRSGEAATPSAADRARVNPEAAKVAAPIANERVRGAFEAWMAAGLASREREEKA